MTKFFNRNWKAGFTLVELIVVIAILAILAGIAIPVYNSYITKANEAADNQLLAAVNTAFGAACLENQTEPRAVNAAASLDSNGAASVNPFNEQFQAYFAGNGNFKVYKSLVYIKADGVFAGSKVGVVNNNDGTFTVTLANGQEVTYTVSDEAIAAIQASTFGTEMTMPELMEDVSSVVGAAVGALSGSEEEKINTLRNLLGGDDGLTALGLDPTQDYTASQLGNALVLMVASNTGDATVTAIQSALGGGGYGALIAEGGLTSPQTLANVAAAYGMMEGYANSEIGKTTMVTYTDDDGEHTTSVYDYFTTQSAALSDVSGGSAGLNAVLSMMQTITGSDGIDEYMSSGQAEKDLTGYVSAMSVIGANVDTMVDGNDILSTGFDNTDLAAILNGILG